MRDPSARIRRTASCRPQTATSPHIHRAVPREGAHGSRTSSTRKSLNPASYRGMSISAPSGPTRNDLEGLAGASIAHLHREWEQEVSEVRADARQKQPKAEPKPCTASAVVARAACARARLPSASAPYLRTDGCSSARVRPRVSLEGLYQNGRNQGPGQ